MSNRGIVRLSEAATEPVREPWANVPPGKEADMEKCVTDVMAKDSTLDKSAATAICYTSVVEGKDLDEAMQTFKLSMEKPVSPSVETAPVAEAATIKAKVRGIIRALDELLGEKELPDTIRSGVKGLRETFRKTWADLAAEITDSERQSENEPQPSSNSIEHFAESYQGAVIAEGEVKLNPARAPLNLPVRLIRPGWGNSQQNHYYRPAVIKAAEKLFEGKKMYTTNHVEGEKNVMTEVSTINKIARYDEDGSPIADVTIFNPDFAEMVRTRQAAGKLDTLECSILGSGSASSFEQDGRRGKLVEQITDIQSVDWVTRGGAGGGALPIAENQNTKPEGAHMADITNVEVHKTTPETTAPAPVAEAATTAPAAPVTLSEAEVSALLEAEKRLPASSRERLAKGQYKDGEAVKAAITDKLLELKDALGSGQVYGLGAAPTAPKKTASEALAEAEAGLDKAAKKHGMSLIGGDK